MYNHRTRVIITNPHGKVLVMVRNFREHAGKSWPTVLLPGGGIDEGESAEEALRRETLEECGLEIHDLKFLWRHKEKRVIEAAEAKYWPGVTVLDNVFDFYTASVDSVKVPALLEPEKFDDVSWIELDELGEYSMKHKCVQIGDGVENALELFRKTS
jgi:8-oxo-dGTP diphosphatase